MNLPLIDGALFVSSSFLDLGCPMQQYYYKIAKRVPMDSGGARTFGKHLHSALRVHHTVAGDLEVKRALTLAQLTKDFELEPVNCTFRTLPWAMDLYSQYAIRHPNETWEVMANSKGPMAEFTFCTPLTQVDGIPVFYHGIVDLLVRRGNLLYVLDFKSTSRLGQSYWDDKRVLSQMRGYAWALGPYFKDLTVDGYIIRALRTTPPPQSHANKKPAEQRAWWDESFGDELYNFGPGELDEWRVNAIEQVREFVTRVKAGFFPMQRSLCVGKYGRCDWYDVCNVYPPENRAGFLATDAFTDKTETMNHQPLE